MAHGRYRPGDSVVLKPGIFGSIQPAGSVVSVMPLSQGVVHYRIRFQNENFERSIRQDDIDVEASPLVAVAHASRDTANIEIKLDQLEFDPYQEINTARAEKETLCRFWSETTMLNRRSAS